MTVVGWIVYFIVVGVVVGITAAILLIDPPKKKYIAITFAVEAVLFIVLLCGMIWRYQNTEAGKRAFKTQASNFSGGLEREINVYDMEGDLIVTYSGKFDVTYDDNRILFDDENGKRHTVYYSTGTVTIDEK